MRNKYSLIGRLLKENILEDTPEEVIEAAEEEENVPVIDDLTFWTVVDSVDPSIVDQEAPSEIQAEIEELEMMDEEGEEL